MRSPNKVDNDDDNDSIKTDPDMDGDIEQPEIKESK